jgi:hypothetical protein
MAGPGLRKLLLLAHLAATLGWAGALAVFFVFSIVGLTSADPLAVRAAYIAMGASTWWMILPLSLLSVATGLVQALVTAWGIARHYWVIAKLLLTIVAAGVLLLKLGPIDEFAVSATRSVLFPGDLRGLRISLFLHAAVGLAILLATAALGVYKPVGITAAPMPPWVKACAAALGTLVLAVIVMLVAGGHGPRMHGTGTSDTDLWSTSA